MNFGDHLRAARSARGITVRDISVRTRIALRSLEALEQNEIGKLPGGIFSRAFVRAYAQEVGLDPDETVRMFVQQFPIDHVTAGSTDAVEGEIDRGHEALRRRQRLGYLLAVAIGIPLVGLAAYLITSARRPASASDLATTTPPSAEAPAATASSATTRATPTAAAAANGVGTVPVSATTSAAAAGAAEPTSPIKGGAAAALLATDALRVDVTSAGPCWVRVRGDGAIRWQGTLQPGDKQSGDAREALDLIVGDAGQFRFTINGRQGRSVGKSGEVVLVHITRQNWQTWLQP